MATKRKPRKRKPSSRKRARRIRRRPRRRSASRPRANTPSSDEDFVLDGDGEESSSDSTEQGDSEQAEDTDEDEEEEDGTETAEVRNSGSSVGRRRQASVPRNGIVNATSHRSRRLKENSSDEDFNADEEMANGFAGNLPPAIRPSAPSRPRRQRGRETELDADFDKDAQRSLEDNGIRREGQPANHASQSRRQHARRNSSDEDFDMDTERVLEDDGTGEHANRASRPTRVRRRRHRQDSSDEDFEVDMERVLENSGIANEGEVATRPMTRAITENSDALQQVSVRGLGAGEPSLQTSNPQETRATYVRRGSSAVKHTEIDKRKGKEKVFEGEESAETLLSNAKASDANEESAAVVCGICLTEMVVAERGKLDCCDHHFCFGCIMEWAKVESRCPMCKQRFTTIAKSGTAISKRTRTIRIPVRDQVYIPPEDQDLPLEDPYADIVCMECHGTGDEGLLLLCDHCDSAAHTFCVGLGRSVPRGDWYCRDCQASIGGISGSEDEAEDLVVASDEEDEEEEDDDDEYEDNHTESLIRSIVASANPGSHHTRQTRTQRRPTSTSTSPPLSINGRSRLWQRLSRRRRGRSIAAPRLSQTARTLLLSSERNQVPRASETPQNGSARTVPQQRRLHERINEMRNNWGRIQNGDLQFDALRTGATGPNQPAVSSNSNVAPIPPTRSIGSDASDKRDVGSVERPESSTQGNKDLQRAWRMLDHAQNLSDCSKSHQQKFGASPSPSTLRRDTQPSANATSSATNSLPFARKNLEMPTCNVPENGNSGTYKPGSTPLQIFLNLKRNEIPLTRPIVPSALTTVSGECRKEELPCSSNPKQTLAAGTPPIDCDQVLCRSAGGKHTASFLENVSKKIASTEELAKSSRHFEKKHVGITQTVTESKSSKYVSAARENIVASSLSSPPHEGLKVHLTELVKKQTWPVYIAERLDKEQFKRIARAAVHSLLALCDPNNRSMSLSCVHLEDHATNSVVKCCNKCLDQQVEKAVKNAKDKIIPR